MNLICPQCNQPIGQDDYNIGTDIAYCRLCDVKYSLATLSSMEEVGEQAFDEFEQAFCRELGREATAAVPFNKVFRIVGVALLLCVPGTLVVFVTLSQSKPMEELWPIILIVCVGLLPNLLISFFFLAGKYVVSIEHGLLRVRTGVFPIRRSKQNNFDRTTTIQVEKNASVRVNNQPVDQIAVETDGRKIGFGVMLSKQNKTCLIKWLAKHAK